MTNACTTIEFPEEGGQKAQGESIQNGTPEWANARKAVMFFDANNKYFCSGVLLDNRHVITARHCNVSTTAGVKVRLIVNGVSEEHGIGCDFSQNAGNVDIESFLLDAPFSGASFVTKLYPKPTDTFVAGSGLAFTCFGAGPYFPPGMVGGDGKDGSGIMRSMTLPLVMNGVVGLSLNVGLRSLVLGSNSTLPLRALKGDSGGPCFINDQLVGLMFDADGGAPYYTYVEPIELFRHVVDYSMFSWVKSAGGAGLGFIGGPAAVSTAPGHVDVFATALDPATGKYFVYHRSEQNLSVQINWYKTPLETPYPPAVVAFGTSSSISAASVYITKADHTVVRRVWENNVWQQEETIPTIRCEGGPAITSGGVPQVYCAASVGTGKYQLLRGGFLGSGSIGHAANGGYDERYPVDTNGELSTLLAPGAILNVPMLFARTYASSEVYVSQRFIRFLPTATFWNNTSLGLGSAAPGATSWDSSRLDAFIVVDSKLYHQERIGGEWARTSTRLARTNISQSKAGGTTADMLGKPAAVTTGFGKMSIYAVSTAADRHMVRVDFPANTCSFTPD